MTASPPRLTPLPGAEKEANDAASSPRSPLPTEETEQPASTHAEENDVKGRKERENENEQQQERKDSNADADSVVEEEEEEEEGETTSAPPLPDEDVPPPLPDEAPPGENDGEDDGWQPVWDATAQAYYFYNRFTGVSQWENPRVPADAQASAAVADNTAKRKYSPALGGYDPAIHGDYDPTAPYAQQYEQQGDGSAGVPGMDPTAAYAATGTFNRFTGRWQPTDLTPENFNAENKAKRQMRAFFDVDAAANSHDGRSLKAERSAKKLSRKEVKQFKEKRRERKEEKRRAWLRD